MGTGDGSVGGVAGTSSSSSSGTDGSIGVGGSSGTPVVARSLTLVLQSIVSSVMS
jgi:hypothetical protein